MKRAHPDRRLMKKAHLVKRLMMRAHLVKRLLKRAHLVKRLMNEETLYHVTLIVCHKETFNIVIRFSQCCDPSLYLYM